MKDHKIRNIVYLVVITSLLSSCNAIKLMKSAKITQPVITFVDHKMGQPTEKKVIIDLNFNAFNPNKIGLKNISVNYELLTEGKRFIKGDDIRLALAPNSNTKIVIPAEIVYKDLFNVLGDIAKKIIFKQKYIRITAKVAVYGNPTLYNDVELGGFFSFNVKLDKTIDVPIPHDKIKKAETQIKKKLEQEFRKLFK